MPVLLGLGRRKQALPGLETSMVGLEVAGKRRSKDRALNCCQARNSELVVAAEY